MSCTVQDVAVSTVYSQVFVVGFLGFVLGLFFTSYLSRFSASFTKSVSLSWLSISRLIFATTMYTKNLQYPFMQRMQLRCSEKSGIQARQNAVTPQFTSWCRSTKPLHLFTKSIWGQLEKNHADSHHLRNTRVSLPEQQFMGMKALLDEVVVGSAPFSVLLT